MLNGKLLIDAHCHVGEGVHYRLMPEELLAQMDELGIDRALLVPTDRHIAVDNVEGNDLLLRTMERWPDRFWGLATVNPWYGDRAVTELHRSVRAGLVGLKLHPILQGFLLCDPLVYPVVEAAIELSVPIYFHTGTPVNALPLQLAELAQRYPGGRFIMGHMGNPDFWLDVPMALSQAPNLWAELSPNLPAAVDRVVHKGFADRLVFGSDAPMTDLRLEVMKIQYWQVSEEQRAAIMAGNLLRLLGQSEGEE
ncbi:MAG TPA: amidohydrolase [Anaerolineae bacterium]|nr:amidohydrolase [Anaerolineae bacterium]HIQ05102.1 amidohydrolase [Anaerolineae bacterium]